jgi:hypothetical protein
MLPQIQDYSPTMVTLNYIPLSIVPFEWIRNKDNQFRLLWLKNLQTGAIAPLSVIPASNYDLYCEPISHVATTTALKLPITAFWA